MASLGALRRFDDQGNWLTTGHAVITVQDEAALPGLVVDAEVGQTVFCADEESMWVFNGTEHIPVGGGADIYMLVELASGDEANGYLTLFNFLDDTKVPVGSWGVVGHSIGFNTGTVPNLVWYGLKKQNINIAAWVTIPVGTIVEKVAKNTIRERSRPSGGNLTGIDAADEAKSINQGTFAIATEDLDLAPADFTGWTWITEFTGSIAMSGGTIPAGTIVERTGQTEITERSRPAVQNVLESDSVAGDYFIDLDWSRFEEYEVVISTPGGIQFQANTTVAFWGNQTSSFDASSLYNIQAPANTWKQLVPNNTTVFRMTLTRAGSGSWSFDLNAGATNIPGVGNVQEFIAASGYATLSSQPTRVGFKLPGAVNTISVIGRSRHA